MLGNKIQKTVGKEIQWSRWVPQLQIKSDEAESCIDVIRAEGERKSGSTQPLVILFVVLHAHSWRTECGVYTFKMTFTNVNICCQWIVYLDITLQAKICRLQNQLGHRYFFNFIKAIFRIKEKHYLIYQLQGHGIWSLTLVHVCERVRRWYIAILTLKRYIENGNSTPQNDKEPHDEGEGTLSRVSVSIRNELYNSIMVQ